MEEYQFDNHVLSPIVLNDSLMGWSCDLLDLISIAERTNFNHFFRTASQPRYTQEMVTISPRNSLRFGHSESRQHNMSASDDDDESSCDQQKRANPR